MFQPISANKETDISLRPIESLAPVYELTVRDVDWERASPSELVWMTRVIAPGRSQVQLEHGRQEHHFDHYFGTFPDANGAFSTEGFAG